MTVQFQPEIEIHVVKQKEGIGNLSKEHSSTALFLGFLWDLYVYLYAKFSACFLVPMS